MSLKNLLAIVAIVALAGCKIVITVPEGGRVASSSGTNDCEAGETCIIDVVDLFFDDTFSAEPADGWHFTVWQKTDRGLCGGKEGSCRLYTSDLEGNAPLRAFLDKPDEQFFLVPTFNEGAGPSADNCEYTQSTPGGLFDVCHADPEMDLNTCSALAGTLTSVDCNDDSPVGVCVTPIGDLYYYEGDPQFLEIGCGFSQGEWSTF